MSVNIKKEFGLSRSRKQETGAVLYGKVPPQAIELEEAVLGAVIAMGSVLLVFQLGQPRILMAMARDGLLPQFFARIHPVYRTPYVTTILTGVVVGGVAMLTDIGALADLTNIGTLFAFVLVCLGVVVLRRTDPTRPRPFRVPLVPLFPILGVILCGCLMLSLPILTWLRFFVWLIIGLFVYYFYSRKRSEFYKG